MKSLLLPLIALGLSSAAAVAQTNTYAFYNLLTTTKTSSWLDPSSTLNVPITTSSTATTSNWVLRNMANNTQTVLETFIKRTTLPGTSIVRNQRVFRVNLAVNGLNPLWNTAVFSAPGSTLIRQRYPNSSLPLRYELFRSLDNQSASANPVFTNFSYMSGREKTTLLPISLLSLTFPTSMTGSGAAWERRKTGIAPFVEDPDGVKILISTVKQSAKLDVTRSDSFSSGNDIAVPGGTEVLVKGTNGFATYKAAEYLQNLGYVNEALLPATPVVP